MSIKHHHLPKYNIGAHFLTAKTFHNVPYFYHPHLANIVCEELEAARKTYHFQILAFVVMPDHIHLLLWWAADDFPNLTISKIAWAVKGKSARRIVDYLKNNPVKQVGYPPELHPVRQPENKSHHRNWKYRIWQPGAGYDFNIVTAAKLREKVGCIHRNPVKAGLAHHPADYPRSSYVNYAKQPTRHLVQITNYAEVI